MFKKMEKESFYYGFPVVLMTTKDEMTGNDNLTPISSTWTLGKTIVIGISMHSKGYTNLKVGLDTGVGTPDAEIAVACLKEYMEDFQERNPNFYVFNAVMHLDEATPHLHIDYIPLGHFFNGLEKRNAMA